MAYTPKMFGKDTDKEQEQLGLGGVPALGSSGMGAGAGNMGGGTGVPQAKEAPQAQSQSALGPGTGFVNIDRMLGANQGIGGQVTKAGNQALKNEANSFSSALGSAETAAGLGHATIGGGEPTSSNPMQPGKGWAWDAGLGIGSKGPKSAAGDVSSLLGGTATADNMSAITAALGAAPTGSPTMSYRPGTGMQQASALANPNSTGKQLAENAQGFAGGLAAYSPQLDALDKALYGQEKSAVSARNDLKSQVKGAKADEQKRVADYATRYGMNADSIRSTVKALRDQLAAGAGDIRNNAATQARLNSDDVVSLRPENFISPQQANALTYISQALGDPSLAMAATPRDLEAESQARYAQRSGVATANAGSGQRSQMPQNPSDEEITAARKKLADFGNSLGVGSVLAGPLASVGIPDMWQAGYKKLQDELDRLLAARAAYDNGPKIANTR